ncbi:MAG: FAD-dependent oxidoreductase [Desulfuromonadales bacterium]|nr:FAD-dependent oxidoreductase [Desulfuromonadales bacterium]
MTTLPCELLVAGGGVAGVCAALAAARSGGETLLVESHPWLGGTGTTGMLRHICGLYGTGDTVPTETLNGGLTDEIVKGLARRAPLRTVRKMGQVYVLPYEDSDLRTVLTDLCGAERKLRVLTSSTVTEVVAGDGRIDAVCVATPDGPLRTTTDMAIDCTGNANLAALAGATCNLSPPAERQLAGFTIRVNGLRVGDDLLSIKVPYFCAKGVEQGLLPPLLRFTTFFSGDDADEGFCKLSLDGEEGHERDQRAHDWSRILLSYLESVLPAFRGAGIGGTAQAVLEREGRRVLGEYTLTGDDVLTARKFPDAVVKNAWPVEIWDRSKGTRYQYVPEGDFYEIPLGCLRVQGVSNLLAAGRCISATPAALASTRVMGTCMALGEQAGLAAVWCLRK